MGKQSRSLVVTPERKAPRENSIVLVESKLSTSAVTRGCLHPKLGLPSIADKSIHHTITDPPFEAHTHKGRKRVRRGSQKSTKHKISKVEIGFDAIDAFQREAVAREIVRVTMGWALIFCEDTAIKIWQDSLIDAGASRRVTCIWTKPNALPQLAGHGPAQPCEHIVCVWCGKGKSVWNGGGKVGNYSFAVDNNSTRVNSTEKPIELMQQLVLDFTMPGQLIADPYFGSGTTLVAAKQMGRKFIGWEIDPKMRDAATKRLRSAREQTVMAQMMAHRVMNRRAFGLPSAKKVEQSEFDYGSSD